MIRYVLPALVLFGLVACETTPPSLYDRLGGKAAISAVVDEFVANIAADSSIAPRFAKTDIPKLKVYLVDQICEATGGPCKYTGRTMKESHQHLNITEACHRRFDNLLRRIHVRDVVGIGHRLPALFGDLGADRLGCLALDVVDNDVRAFGGEGQRVLAPEPGAGAGDDDSASVADTHVLTSIAQ